MKVVILGRYPIGGSATDGALRHILGLSRALARIEDVDLHVVTLGQRAGTSLENGYRVHVVQNSGLPLDKAFFSSWPLIRKVAEIKPDLVHCIGTTQPYGLPALYLARRYKYKVVASTLGIAQLEVRFWFSSPIYLLHKLWFAWIERQVFRSLPVIVQADNISKKISRWSKQSVYVVPLGIDPEFFTAKRRVEHGLIVSLSVVSPIKGVLDLVKAFALLEKRNPFVRLVHAGGIASQEYYRRILTFLEENSLADKVTFLGNLPNVVDLLERAQLFVLPSYEETFGLAAAEAMAVGVPVVVTRVGGLVELVGGGTYGLLAEAGSPEDLAEKMERVILDEVIANRLSMLGKERAIFFSWEKSAMETFRIYQQLLDCGN